MEKQEKKQTMKDEETNKIKANEAQALSSSPHFKTTPNEQKKKKRRRKNMSSKKTQQRKKSFVSTDTDTHACA